MSSRAPTFRTRASGVVMAAALPLLFACGDDDPTGPSATPPAAPEVNDPDFTVSRVRDWYLIGNPLTAGHDQLEVAVVAPPEVELIDLWIDDQPGIRLVASGGEFRQIVDISALGPGEHQLLLAADQGDTGFARLPFRRSHPLYTMVGTDWDDADNSDTSLTLQDQLHQDHAELKLTHFVGPYTFTDPALTVERVAILVDWLTQNRDTYADEIAVHIHPRCTFVGTTGVTCRTEPSVVYDAGDATGYTVECAAYTEQEFTLLLEAADALFMAHGFAKPTSFRAGAWTADLSTLKALVNAGYTADSDAYNWARMEEWIGVGNGLFYEWVKAMWAPINDTSQPYFPSEADIAVAGEPALPLLEVPLNGVMVDYVDETEMKAIFDANWDGTTPLVAPKVYAIGLHPSNFDQSYWTSMDRALTYVDQHLASYDHGPVVYATLAELTQVWPIE